MQRVSPYSVLDQAAVCSADRERHPGIGAHAQPLRCIPVARQDECLRLSAVRLHRRTMRSGLGYRAALLAPSRRYIHLCARVLGHDVHIKIDICNTIYTDCM